MAIQYLSGGILDRTNSAEQGSGALLDLPYDMGWVAGYTDKWVAEDITVRTYGESIMPRSGEFIGEAAYIDTQCTGTNLEMQIFKNGTTIYNGAQNPKFGVSSSTHTAGVFSVTTFVAGDRITFKVTQVGSGTAGQGVRIALKCRV